MATRDHPDWWRPVGGSNSIDSVLERRATFVNAGAAEGYLAAAGTTRRGKFFPRGMRGWLDLIAFTAQDGGALGGTITVYVAPYIGCGYLYWANVVVAPGFGPGSLYAQFQVPWNYDSLFIWFLSSTANMQVAYDTGTPQDAYLSTDGGATWVDQPQRLNFRPVIQGLTPGDVPISGTINNIPIPNVSTAFERDTIAILQNVTTEIIDIHGAGFVDYFYAYLFAQASSHQTQILVECDDIISWNHSFDWLNNWTYNDDTQPTCLMRFAEDGDVMMMITKKWEFRRRFRILAYNGFAGVTVSVTAFPNLVR